MYLIKRRGHTPGENTTMKKTLAQKALSARAHKAWETRRANLAAAAKKPRSRGKRAAK